MEFTVGMVVDIFNPEGEREEELSGEVIEVSEDTVTVKPKNKNVPEPLAQLMGLDQMRILHNLDGTAKVIDEQDADGWSIKPHESGNASA